MAVLVPLVHLCQACLTLYTLQYSHASITALIGGDTAQRVAKYSNKAALRVFHSKGTQSAGLASLITSLLLSLFLAVSVAFFEGGESDTWPGLAQRTRVLLNLGEVILVAGSVAYIRNFWKARAKVPMSRANDYNEAITTTNEMRVHLGYLAVLWGTTGVLELWGLLW